MEFRIASSRDGAVMFDARLRGDVMLRGDVIRRSHSRGSGMSPPFLDIVAGLRIIS